MHFARRSPGPLAILLLAVAANAIALHSNLAVREVYRNDNVSHLALIAHIADAMKHGANPLDFWMPEWNLGSAMVRAYPALAHELAALASLIFGSPADVLAWSWYLCLVLTPVSYFACARMLGLSPFTAAAAAVLAPLISTDGLYGLDFDSYLWAGKGLFSQAVAVHFLLWSLGLGFRALARRGAIVPAGAAIGATVLTHWVYGYIAALSICLLAVRTRQYRRLLAIGGVALLLAGYQIVTLVRDSPFLNRSRNEFAWKSDSFGAAQVLKWLFTGQLLDYGRIPVLSLLALAGTALVLIAWIRCRRLRAGREFVLAGAVLWTLLYFGRPFWGGALVLLGITRDMHLHRFIGGVHVFSVLLAAIALGKFWWEGERRVPSIVTIAITVALLFPMAREREDYIRYSAAEAQEAQAELENRRGAIDRITSLARARGGRVYVRPLVEVTPRGANAPSAPAREGRRHVKSAFEALPYFVYAGLRQIPVIPDSLDSLALTAEIMPDFDESNPDHYRIMQVTTVVEPVQSGNPAAPFWGAPQTIGDFRVFEAPPADAFDLVNVTATVAVTRDSFFYVNDAWMASDWVARRSHLRLSLKGEGQKAGSILPASSILPPPAGAVIGDGPYSAHYDAAQDCSLLFKTTWHPNWKAYLDGKPVRTEMLSPGVIGIAAPHGAHRVEFRYEPDALRPALAVFGVGSVLLLGIKKGKAVKPSPFKSRIGKL